MAKGWLVYGYKAAGSNGRSRQVYFSQFKSRNRTVFWRCKPFWHARLQWYHWFQATRRGAQAVRDDAKGFAHIMWETWSPPGWFDETDFDRVAESSENPDWVDVTLHSYRSRWDESEPDPISKWLDDKIKATKTIALSTVYFQGELDGVNPPKTSEQIAEKFTGPFERIVLPGVGHFPTHEAPAEVAARLPQHFAGNNARASE
ncbi:MAG: alpha/beta hydrolase [Methylovirgula sp.]|uniref:alpha/beta fold hydrolase n=1 Tax=Methylovirgula sp. TaxID=1978224 RepID=UPI0030761820